MRHLILASGLLLLLSFTGIAYPPPQGGSPPPPSKDALRAMQTIRLPKGMSISLWAGEPMLANPVAFCIDHKGRIYVAETYRLHQGVTDIRRYLNPKKPKDFWLDEDLACRTVEDRVALLQRRLGPGAKAWAEKEERIRLLEDTTGTGRADRSVVFADGFRSLSDGIAAGLLARGRDLYYACLPNLWLLRDTKGVGKADVRKQLHTGYGVHIGYIGHDLHGLVLGPDGKLYFSIGDRGLNVRTKDRHLFYPDTGCVLRCNLDGSDLEVFASGLRNPQELAFDRYGNLFTGENNSDGGDRARWVYIVQGGDCGWRIGYQFGGAQSNRGPWNAEKLWHPPHPGQPAWIIPPITNLGDGPSGLAYYPGVGLPARYDEHFFLADFRGSPGPSGIRSFAVKPKGAGFELTDSHQFIWSVLATDVDFAPDGSMVLSDWVQGWGLTGKGRIWKVTDPTAIADPIVKQVRTLLGEGFGHRPEKELTGLLAHRDMRVRLEAQWSLAAKGKQAIEPFAGVATNRTHQLARLHAVWGLGQIGRTIPQAYASVMPLLSDADAEVRSQAAKVLGEGRVAGATAGLVALLKDEASRVRFFAAEALGKIGSKDAVPALLAMLRKNNDEDLYLRHAGVMGLVGCRDDRALAEAARDPSATVRRAVLLAYRRLESPEVARFLEDADASLVGEAARAINDVPINAAMPRLAGLIDRRGLSEPVAFRVLNANYRLGNEANARAVARFAGRSDVAEKLRIEALTELADWAKPSGRDRIMGLWRPLTPRSPELARDALRPALGAIFSGPDGIRKVAARVAAELGVKEIGPALFALVSDRERPALVRVETLRALATLRDARLDQAVRLALADGEPLVRAEGRRILARQRPDEALDSLRTALEKGASVEKQQAFDVLGEMKSGKADDLLQQWMKRLVEGKVPPEVRLDLVEAVESKKSPALRALLKQYEAARPKTEPFGRWRESLVGGDAENGRRIFLYRSDVSCLRCHKAGGEGVGEVGPDLTGIGAKQPASYLLESIVLPNKQIAKGFETVELVLTTGQLRSGVLRGEDATHVRLITPEGAILTVRKDQIEERRSGKSAMPEDLIKHLSRKEVRDLVAFLAGLKEAPKK